jgi:hypothetical protein
MPSYAGLKEEDPEKFNAMVDFLASLNGSTNEEAESGTSQTGN